MHSISENSPLLAAPAGDKPDKTEAKTFEPPENSKRLLS
jgi:hypothetical protein